MSSFFTLWKDADPDIPILKEAKTEYAQLQQKSFAKSRARQHRALPPRYLVIFAVVLGYQSKPITSGKIY